MRFDLSDREWSIIEPQLPPTRQGGERADDRRVLDGIFYVLRSGIPWSDLPSRYGPPTTVYNRFRRWAKQGIWERIFQALQQQYPSSVEMIDTTMIPAHRAAAGARGGFSASERDEAQAIGTSRGGRTTKCHGVCDEHGRLRRFLLTAGQRHDMMGVWDLMDESPLDCTALIADKGYDSQELRAWLRDQDLTPVIPKRGEDGQKPEENSDLYRERNLIERAFNRMKDYRRFAMRFDKLKVTFEATVALIAMRTWFL